MCLCAIQPFTHLSIHPFSLSISNHFPPRCIGVENSTPTEGEGTISPFALNNGELEPSSQNRFRMAATRFSAPSMRQRLCVCMCVAHSKTQSHRTVSLQWCRGCCTGAVIGYCLIGLFYALAYYPGCVANGR